MRRKEIKTLEEYYQHRSLYSKLVIGFYIIYIAVLLGVVVFFYTWRSGLLRNFNIAFYGTIAAIFVFLYRSFAVPCEFLAEGRNPDYFAIWFSDFYERCPRWVKKIAERSCAKRSGGFPEDELLRLTRKMKKFSPLFLVIAWLFTCLQLLSLWMHFEFIKALATALRQWGR